MKKQEKLDVYYTPLIINWETYKKESTTLLLGIRIKGSINLGIASVDTEPKSIKSGDDNVKILVSIENSGEAIAF